MIRFIDIKSKSIIDLRYLIGGFVEAFSYFDISKYLVWNLSTIG